MRLRYLAIDYFEVASNLLKSLVQRCWLPVPRVRSTHSGLIQTPNISGSDIFSTAQESLLCKCDSVDGLLMITDINISDIIHNHLLANIVPLKEGIQRIGTEEEQEKEQGSPLQEQHSNIVNNTQIECNFTIPEGKDFDYPHSILVHQLDIENPNKNFHKPPNYLLCLEVSAVDIPPVRNIAKKIITEVMGAFGEDATATLILQHRGNPTMKDASKLSTGILAECRMGKTYELISILSKEECEKMDDIHGKIHNKKQLSCKTLYLEVSIMPDSLMPMGRKTLYIDILEQIGNFNSIKKSNIVNEPPMGLFVDLDSYRVFVGKLFFSGKSDRSLTDDLSPVLENCELPWSIEEEHPEEFITLSANEPTIKNLISLEVYEPIEDISSCFYSGWGFLNVFKSIDASYFEHDPSSFLYCNSEGSISYREFIELPELSLKNDYLKPLPVPLLSNGNAGDFAMEIAIKFFSACKHSADPSHGMLYLNWHYSMKMDCGNHGCFLTQKKMRDALHCNCLDYPKKPAEESKSSRVVLEVLKLCDEIDSPITETDKKEPLLQFRDSVELQGFNGNIPSEDRRESGEKDQGRGVSPSLEHKPVCNDLSYFLQVRKGISFLDKKEDEENKSGLKENHNNLKKTKYYKHIIELEAPLQQVLDCLDADYSRVLDRDLSLQREIESYHQSIRQLCLGKSIRSELTELIKSRVGSFEDSKEQDILRGLIAIYVIQQAAENLCMFGVQIAYFYLCNLIQELCFLKEQFLSFPTLEEAFSKVEKGSIEDHPKLSYLERIMKCHRNKYPHARFLVVSERRAFFSLYRTIYQTGARSFQFDREENYLHDDSMPQEVKKHAVKRALEEAYTKYDCVMVSSEYCAHLYPLKETTCLILYGDFLNEWDEMKTNDIFGGNGDCEVHAFEVPARLKGYRSLSPQNILIPDKQEQKQNLSPILLCAEETYTESLKAKENRINGTQMIKVFDDSNSKPEESQQIVENTSSHFTENNSKPPKIHVYDQFKSAATNEMTLVVNVSHSDEILLTARRSSYQNIISFEKEGLKVIERDLYLPVDIILSPMTCLVWYTKDKLLTNNFSSSNDFPEEGFDDVVRNVIKAISFSFQCCIMIFEGSWDFQLLALQSFGNLYAAAIGMEVELHCFVAESSATMDMIVANCIRSQKCSENPPLHPIMLESQTFTESFLTSFPSLNTITANALLSLGLTLREFFSKTQNEQATLTQPFDIPKRSLMLLKEQMQHGKLGGSSLSSMDSSSIRSALHVSSKNITPLCQNQVATTDKVSGEDSEKSDCHDDHFMETLYLENCEESWNPKGRSEYKDEANIDECSGLSSHKLSLATSNSKRRKRDLFLWKEEEMKGSNEAMNKSFDKDNVKGVLDINAYKKGPIHIGHKRTAFFPQTTRRCLDFGVEIDESVTSSRTRQEEWQELPYFPPASEVSGESWESDIEESSSCHHPKNKTRLNDIMDMSAKKALRFRNENKNGNSKNSLERWLQSIKKGHIKASDEKSSVIGSFGVKPARNCTGFDYFIENLDSECGAKSPRLSQLKYPQEEQLLRLHGSGHRRVQRKKPDLDNFRYKKPAPPLNGNGLKRTYVKHQNELQKEILDHKFSASLRCSTPIDKRSKKELGYERAGKDKQSKLVWGNRAFPSKRQKFD